MTQQDQKTANASLEFDCDIEQISLYISDIEAIEDIGFSYIIGDRTIKIKSLDAFQDEALNSDEGRASILADGVRIFSMETGKSGNEVWKLHCDNKHGKMLLEIKPHIDKLFKSEFIDQDAKNVELRFMKTSNNDMIGYLVAENNPFDCGLSIHSDEEFQNIIRGTSGASARFREIIITDSEHTARALARARHLDNGGDFIITEIADDIHAVGMISHDDVFYDHVPTIIDSREDGLRLKVVGEFGAPGDMGNYRIRNEIDDGRLKLMENIESINPERDIEHSEPDGF